MTDFLALLREHGYKALFAALSSVLAWGYGKLLRRMKTEQTEGRAGRDATRSLLADRMIELYTHASAAGFCPIYARKNMEDMFCAYKALGGNGTIEDLYRRTLALPTEKPISKQGKEIES